jgi:glucuronosyltransferase
MQNLNYIQRIFIVWEITTLLCNKVLGEPPVQKLIHSDDERFDMIIMEAFYIDCFLGFAHKFKAPVVQVCPFGGSEYVGDVVGNPNPYSYIPDAFQEFSDKMSFSERIKNTLGGLFQQAGRRYYLIPRQEVIMRKYFNYTSSMPSITDLEKSTALVLVNQHFSLSYPKPMMPNFVQVGGIHIKPPKSLPAVSAIDYTFCMVRCEEI